MILVCFMSILEKRGFYILVVYEKRASSCHCIYTSSRSCTKYSQTCLTGLTLYEFCWFKGAL